MESSVALVKDNPAPKSTGSLIIPISSLYIELKIPKEKNETEGCQHNFSILGYAAEMREKNPTASMPFDTEMQLPPLTVPKFRWWQCSECRSTLTDEAVTGGDAGPVEPVVDKTGGMRDEETIAQIGNIVASGDNKEPTGQVNNDAGNSEIPREFQPSADPKHNPADAKQRTKPMPSMAGDGAHKTVEVAVAGIVNSIGVAPLQVEECGNASSISNQNKKHENSRTVLRRKRKMRYLTELLADKGNLRSDLPRENDSSIQSKLVASSGSRTLVSQGQASCEYIGKGTKSPRRKGKMPQEEPEGISDQVIIGANDSTSKADSERTAMDTAICSSEGQANASSGVHKRIAKKNDPNSKCKTERTPALVKGKNKQIQVRERLSARIGEQLSSKKNVKDGDLGTATSGTLFRSLGTSSAAGKTDNHSKNSRSPQVPEREKRDVVETALLISKFKSSHLKLGPDLNSLNSFAEKIDSSREKEQVSTSRSFPEEADLHFGQCSILPASEPDLPRTKIQVLKSEKTSEVQGHPKDINKQSDQMASNSTAQESLDDIPMDIVEFMAQLQHERGIADAGNNTKNLL